MINYEIRTKIDANTTLTLQFKSASQAMAELRRRRALGLDATFIDNTEENAL